MFQITEEMEARWRRDDKPKATEADIARIEDEIGSTLPAPYIEFATRYGFVIFGRDPEQRCFFDCTFTFPDREEIREGDISHFMNADRILLAYDSLTQPEVEVDDEFPKFPADYLPIGMDAGQGEILLEMGEHSGRVWYWPFNEWAWGFEDNTRLGFVAEDLYGFINGLRPAFHLSTTIRKEAEVRSLQFHPATIGTNPS